MFGTEPIELGLKGYENRFLGDVGRDAVYRKLFPEAFAGENPAYTISNVTKALAAFERTSESPWFRVDRCGKERLDCVS
jgi:cytochrome c peroxidase